MEHWGCPLDHCLLQEVTTQLPLARHIRMLHTLVLDTLAPVLKQIQSDIPTFTPVWQTHQHQVHQAYSVLSRSLINFTWRLVSPARAERSHLLLPAQSGLLTPHLPKTRR